MATDSFYMEVHCVCPESLDVHSNLKLQRKKQMYSMRRIGAALRQLAKSPWKEAKILYDFLLYQLGRKPMGRQKQQIDIKPTTAKRPSNKKLLKVTTKDCPPPK